MRSKAAAIVGLSLGLTSCAGALQTIKPIVHNANEAAQALCAIYEAAKTGSAADSSQVVQFCSIYDNFAPFIATISAKQQEARAGVPLKAAALPDQCDDRASAHPATHRPIAPLPPESYEGKPLDAGTHE